MNAIHGYILNIILCSLTLVLISCGSDSSSVEKSESLNLISQQSFNFTSSNTQSVGCVDISQKAMLNVMNSIRSEGRYCYKNGIKKWYKPASPVKWEARLAKASANFALDMADRNYYDYFADQYEKYLKLTPKEYQKKNISEHLPQTRLNAHLQPDESYKIENAITLHDRVKKVDYLGQFGENIGFSTQKYAKDAADSVTNSWLSSESGHCNTIMNTEVSDFAMTCGYNEDSNTYYFVQLFAIPSKD